MAHPPRPTLSRLVLDILYPYYARTMPSDSSEPYTK